MKQMLDGLAERSKLIRFLLDVRVIVMVSLGVGASAGALGVNALNVPARVEALERLTVSLDSTADLRDRRVQMNSEALTILRADVDSTHALADRLFCDRWPDECTLQPRRGGR